MLSTRNYLLAAAGAALGSVTRFLVGLAALEHFGDDFFWGTLAVNVAGSFLIGLTAAAIGARPGPRGASLAAFVMAGFCGGFTTFSTFSLETVLLLREGSAFAAAAYLLVSLASWMAAVALGWRAGRVLGRR